MAEVLKGINEKLIYRHPHVFDNVKVPDHARLKGTGNT
jgi:uncharacterized protein YabN with tetrapyrrole methylase and pyrophosphatase domain